MLQISKRCLRGKLVVLDHCSSNSSSSNSIPSSRLLRTAAVTAETSIHNSQTCLWNTAIPIPGMMLSLAFAFKIFFQLLVLRASHLAALVTPLFVAVASREGQQHWTWNHIPWWIKLERLITVGPIFSSFGVCTWWSSLAPVHCWRLTSRRCLGSIRRLMPFMDPLYKFEVRTLRF